MQRSSSNIGALMRLGTGLAALLLAAASVAQGVPEARTVASPQLEQRLHDLCPDSPCSPSQLAGRYRIVEGEFAGSELRLDAGGTYSLSLSLAAMLRRFNGRWQLDEAMVWLQPETAPGASVQLLSDQAVSQANEGMRALLEDMQRSAASADEHAQLQAMRAELEGRRLPGMPVFVSLSDPMSGVAAEGVRVALELEDGTQLDGEDVAGNDYRFSVADDAKVRSMVLHFPALAGPVRFPLAAPLRPRYAVLFDACDLGACQSDVMGVVPNQRDGQWVMEGIGVGVFVRADAGVGK